MKYAAYIWVKDYCDETPVYEQQFYSPLEELTENVVYSGMTFDPKIPQIIEKGRTDVYAGDGMIVISDVYCARTQIEVGYTEPFNLLTPMLDGLIDKAIWVPFPPKFNASKFEPFVDSLKPINAYTFIVV